MTTPRWMVKVLLSLSPAWLFTRGRHRTEKIAAWKIEELRDSGIVDCAFEM
jgi:hypothetical protein